MHLPERNSGLMVDECPIASRRFAAERRCADDDVKRRHRRICWQWKMPAKTGIFALHAMRAYSILT